MSRGFEDARETANEMLAEAVAKQLRPMYCARCGSRLQVRNVQHRGFDKDTGYPKYDVTLGCPHATLYETDISREVRFAWKNPFDRHSVHKVSKVIELNSDIADAHCKRGDAYHDMGKYNKAIVEYNVAIKLNPNHASAHYNRAFAYGQIAEYEKAIADYDRVIELDPSDALAYYNRGVAYLNKIEIREGVSDLEKCVELSTDPQLTKAAQREREMIVSLGEPPPPPPDESTPEYVHYIMKYGSPKGLDGKPLFEQYWKDH
jgi:tetratricopeptide (TPR) repeat protein